MTDQKLTLCLNCRRELEDTESLEPRTMGESDEGSVEEIRPYVDAPAPANEQQQPESDYAGAMRRRRHARTKTRAMKVKRQRAKKNKKKAAYASVHKKGRKRKLGRGVKKA